MSAAISGVWLHQVRATIPDDPEARLKFDLRIKALTWEQMLTADGVRRVILANELDERGVSIECRVNLAALRTRIPGATELVVEGPHPRSTMPGSNYQPAVYTFTEEWQPLAPAIAFWFHQAQEFFPELGSYYVTDGYSRRRDATGEIVLNWQEVPVPKVKVLEFRAPADKVEQGPETASGLRLTRVPGHGTPMPAQPTTGLPRGLSLDDLPIEDAPPETGALDALAPAVAAPPPADTVAEGLADLATLISAPPRRSPARKPVAPVASASTGTAGFDPTVEYILPTDADVPPRNR